jgi:hypothetical protein
MSLGLYVAGAGKDAGKTTLSLGLLAALDRRLPGGVSFTKPLGQKTTVVDGDSVGQDSWFIDRALGLDLPLQHSAPFSAFSGAAKRYVTTGEPRDIPARVRDAYRKLSRGYEMVIAEGTGHPGVGSVFGLSNADVAAMLSLPVVLVLDGGFGSTIDMYTQCAALFGLREVPVLGVVVNRMLPSKIEGTGGLLREWFESRGLSVFGMIPYDDALSSPSLGVITRAIGARPVLDGEGLAPDSASGYLTAFGSADEVLREVSRRPRAVMLVSASRTDVLDAVIVRSMSGGEGPGALVVCGGRPGSRHSGACGRAGIPLYAVEGGLEGASRRLDGRTFKVEPEESAKIERIVDLVEDSVDVDLLLERLRGGPSGAAGRRGGPLRRLFSKLVSRGRRLLGGKG